jgi:hypothetical protein
MNTFLHNSWTTWSMVAILVVCSTKMMGASTWSWERTLAVVLVLLAPALARGTFLLFRKKDEEPRHGGDVVLIPGRGVRGGSDGRIVLVGSTHSSTTPPMFSFSWRNVLDRADATVDVFVTPGWLPPRAKEGSFLFTLDEGKVFRRSGGLWQATGEMHDV